MNQWPSAIKYKFNKKLKNFSEKKLCTIENFFSKKFKSKYSFLCPSSRSSINLILNYIKFDRSKIVNKLDNIPGSSQTGTKAVEVDIKREIAIGKVDTSAVKSEEFVGKVKTKKDKLRALRNRRK